MLFLTKYRNRGRKRLHVMMQGRLRQISCYGRGIMSPDSQGMIGQREQICEPCAPKRPDFSKNHTTQAYQQPICNGTPCLALPSLGRKEDREARNFNESAREPDPLVSSARCHATRSSLPGQWQGVSCSGCSLTPGIVTPPPGRTLRACLVRAVQQS